MICLLSISNFVYGCLSRHDFLSQREISQQLGISKAAFYKGIQRLKDKKLIDWEAPNGLVVSLGQIGDSLDKLETVGQIGDSLDKLETPLDKLETPLDKLETPLDKLETLTPSNPPSVKASSPSSNSYQIFFDSLSDLAREKFLNFVREKTAHFSQPINDLEAWLAGVNGAGQARFRVYYAMFQSEVGEGVAPTQDWESHPKWSEAIAAMRRGVPRFLVLGQPGCEDIDKSTRQAMVDYAEANQLIWGEKS
jgi:hypothetical protein